MSSLNITVLSSVSRWLSQRNPVFLVTVIKTWGAAPRPVGSLFAFNLSEGSQTGSLSGGCVEEDLLQYLSQLTVDADFSSLKPHLKRYGDAQDNSGIRLPCGGVLELLIEPLSTFDLKVINHLLDQLTKHQAACRRLEYNKLSGMVQRTVFTADPQERLPVLAFDSESFTLVHRLNPSFRLLIVGAGDVARYLAEFAATVDFTVTLCDPRKDVLKRLPELNESSFNIVNALPDDLIRGDFKDHYVAIVCLSHDPRVDDMALIEALQSSNAFYVGAMGSANTSANRRERLLSLGITEAELAKLRAPIGLDIHSKTPPEIAISIAAELIKQRIYLL